MAMASPVAKLHDNSEDRTIAFLAKMEMGERSGVCFLWDLASVHANDTRNAWGGGRHAAGKWMASGQHQ